MLAISHNSDLHSNTYSIPIGEYAYLPSAMKLLSEVNRDQYRKPHWSKYKVQLTMVYLDPVDTHTTQFLQVRLREYHGSRGRKMVRTRGPKSLRCCLLEMAEKQCTWYLNYVVTWKRPEQRKPQSTWYHGRGKSQGASFTHNGLRKLLTVERKNHCSQVIQFQVVSSEITNMPSNTKWS